MVRAAMNRLTISSATLALSLGALCLSACSSEDTPPDSGVTGADASDPVDLGVAMIPDVGRPDAQVRPDSGLADAAQECVMNGAVEVDGVNVNVGTTTMEPVNGVGQAGDLRCRAPLSLRVLMRVQGCINFIGAVPSQAELDQLDIEVFSAVNPDDGEPTDPTYDPATGLDRTPAARVSPDVVLSYDQTACPGGVRMVLGGESIGTSALGTGTSYIIRTRSSTVGIVGEPLFVDQYFFGMIVYGDQLELGGGATDRCTPAACAGRMDLVVARRHALHLIGGMTGTAIEGFANLSDHVGSGHAMIQTMDCGGISMSNVASGFTPAPAARSYLTATNAHSGAATVTSTTGILLGLGFTGTTTAAPRTITAASAVTSDGACMLPFAGGAFPVYPDAISLVRLGRETFLR